VINPKTEEAAIEETDSTTILTTAFVFWLIIYIIAVLICLSICKHFKSKKVEVKMIYAPKPRVDEEIPPVETVFILKEEDSEQEPTIIEYMNTTNPVKKPQENIEPKIE